jgi:histidinol-phosphate/aromatic aminotransferase/cobyric acid decarboxylase-like protein
MNLRPNHLQNISYKKYNLSTNVCVDAHIDYSVVTNPNSYPDVSSTYQLISEYYKVDTRDLMIGFGIGELFPRILQFIELGSLSVVEPAWPMLEVYEKIYNIKMVKIKKDNFFEIPFDEIYEPKTNSIYISNPNGLNGTVISKNEIIKLTEIYRYVIIDEAYMDFSNQSLIDIYRDYNNLIILKTFSKTIASPGIRFGFCLSSNQEVIKKLQNTRLNSVITTDTINLIPKLLLQIPEHISRMNKTKKYIEQNYDCFHSEGNYVLLKSNEQINLKNVSIKEVSRNVHRIALFNIEIFNEIFI